MSSKPQKDLVVEAREFLPEVTQERKSAFCKAVTHKVVLSKAEWLIRQLCSEVEQIRPMTDPQTKPELLSDETLAEIEARANAATGGWYIEDEKDAVRYGFRIYDKYHQGVCKMTNGGEFHDRPHSQFILHARTDIPALIQTVRAAWVESERLKDQLALTQGGIEKFSNLADERHDLLSEERRLNDDLRAERAGLWKLIEDAEKTNTALREQYESAVTDFAVEITALREQLAQAQSERNEARQKFMRRCTHPNTSLLKEATRRCHDCGAEILL